MPDDRTTAPRSGDQARGAPASRGPIPARPGSDQAHAAARPALTQEDIRRLTLYKWRYSLESCGFTTDQVGHLLFLKWLFAASAGVRG
ncbi:MAG: hypothetical protein H0V51_11590 [Chloroflexi bacterium]|nr:hypothetical protein [Chloroflexota bacterium]